MGFQNPHIQDQKLTSIRWLLLESCTISTVFFTEAFSSTTPFSGFSSCAHSSMRAIAWVTVKLFPSTARNIACINMTTSSNSIEPLSLSLSLAVPWHFLVLHETRACSLVSSATQALLIGHCSPFVQHLNYNPLTSLKSTLL